jgi:hypothetical protein
MAAAGKPANARSLCDDYLDDVADQSCTRFTWRLEGHDTADEALAVLNEMRCGGIDAVPVVGANSRRQGLIGRRR